jgi:hypothetical protein
LFLPVPLFWLAEAKLNRHEVAEGATAAALRSDMPPVRVPQQSGAWVLLRFIESFKPNQACVSPAKILWAIG